jgi:hypothetical protein
MVLCPVAITVGCRKCPIFAVCPVKGIIGDQPATTEAEPPAKRKSSKKRKSRR